MKTIKTVKGAIAPTELGFTDIHNHLWKSGGMEVIEDKDFGIESVEKSIQELKSYVAAGGKALVDMQPMGVGRGVNELKAIAKDVDAHVIAITGFHRGGLYDKAHFVHKYSVQQITDLVISEVEKGIEVNDFCGPYVQHSDVLPGLVKAGTSYYKITPLEEKLLEVVAKASLETGIPIKTHTHMGTMGLEQAQIFKGYGVKPEKICIGHLDRNADLVYHRQVLREGVYVQYQLRSQGQISSLGRYHEPDQETQRRRICQPHSDWRRLGQGVLPQGVQWFPGPGVHTQVSAEFDARIRH